MSSETFLLCWLKVSSHSERFDWLPYVPVNVYLHTSAHLVHAHRVRHQRGHIRYADRARMAGKHQQPDLPIVVLLLTVLQGRRQGGAFAGRAPPKRVTVPPTFHPLPSLLNVIDFESESEADKTAHIRKRLHALASVSNCTRSQIARFPPKSPPEHTHTHTVICAPPRNSNAPLMEVPWRRLCCTIKFSHRWMTHDVL